MRERIIKAAIESLQAEGLKFSVDTIASKLKISKKTIYKFFPDKETLAYAIYEKYYADASEEVKKIREMGDNIPYRLLMVYYNAGLMTRKEIFNKYKLNAGISSYAAKQHKALWSVILSALFPAASRTDGAVLKVIIEGAFEKSTEYSVSAELVTEKLVTLL